MNKLHEIAIKCKQSGFGSLSATEQQSLCNFFCKEIRKGAFEIPKLPDDEIRNKFCDYIDAECNVAEMLVVIDYQDSLKELAKFVSDKEEIPISSLILYAAWAEHWINMMIVVLMLKQKLDDKQILKVVRYTEFLKKIDLLETNFGLRKIPSESNKFLSDLHELRNQHIHYKWVGVPETESLALRKRISDVVGVAHLRIKDLEKYEFENIDAQFVELTERVFSGCKYAY